MYPALSRPCLATDFHADCLVYTRGSRADFDRYVAHTGDDGWSWNNMLPYFKKSERFTQPSDRHNTSGQFDPTVHGFAGLNSVSLPGAATGIDDIFSVAINELGGDFAFTADSNTGNPLGFGEHLRGHGVERFLILAYSG